MMTPSIITVAVLAILTLSCGGARPEGVEASPEPAAADQNEQTARPAPARARYPYTEADVRFMSDMIHHHAQALTMAAWAPTHGSSPSLRILAERIMNGQQDEIASIQRWLRDRGHQAPEATGPEVHGHHHQPSAGSRLMPGMLTEAQMKQLDQARGAEFDRLFLKYMIQHHQGAVTMVNRLFNTPGAARDESVFKLASDISADQSSEIKRMQRMLAETRSKAGS
jgi:uncharacterized protein (DUF305 family)